MRHLLSIIVTLFILAGCQTTPMEGTSQGLADKREINLMLDGKWIGNGISYSAYRDGEGPDKGSLTDKKYILEDFNLLLPRWQFIRNYGAGQQERHMLEVIRDNNLPIRVMQGAWISGKQTPEQNDEQVANLIKLANDFPDIIVAVNVGNEIFVDWSWHKVEDMDRVIEYIREVRSKIKQPVTVNDDYNFWNKPHAAKIVAEVDFIGLHAYAFWNDKKIGESIDWTIDIYNDIQSRHPHHIIAYCETGWPTSRIWNDGSYEGGLTGVANEENQVTFFEGYNAWVDENKIISLYFQSFDEKWKGGFDGENPMDKAEKHWGVFFSDRTPKQVLK